MVSPIQLCFYPEIYSLSPGLPLSDLSLHRFQSHHHRSSYRPLTNSHYWASFGTCLPCQTGPYLVIFTMLDCFLIFLFCVFSSDAVPFLYVIKLQFFFFVCLFLFIITISISVPSCLPVALPLSSYSCSVSVFLFLPLPSRLACVVSGCPCYTGLICETERTIL